MWGITCTEKRIGGVVSDWIHELVQTTDPAPFRKWRLVQCHTSLIPRPLSREEWESGNETSITLYQAPF